MGPIQKTRMADRGLVPACQHITAMNRVLCINTLQTNLLVTHRSDVQSRKNKLCNVTAASVLGVGTASYKNGYR
jgi:hypothetical protein